MTAEAVARLRRGFRRRDIIEAQRFFGAERTDEDAREGAEVAGQRPTATNTPSPHLPNRRAHWASKFGTSRLKSLKISGRLAELQGGHNPPNRPPTSVLLVFKMKKFYTKIFALYSWR